MDFQSKLQELQQRRGKQAQLLEDTARLKQELLLLKRDLRLSEQAQICIQNVAQITQNQLSYKISEIVSLALSSVFNESYSFEVEFVVKRGKTECELWFKRGEERIHPLSASGGGVVDVCCLALRIAMWKLSTKKTDAVFILDEPFSHLSTDLQDRASKMLKGLSEELKLQIIMISHIPDDIESADKVIRVKKYNGVSNSRTT